jgi:hypothetical protein
MADIFVGALLWQKATSNSPDLVAPYACDFTTNASYRFTPKGTIQATPTTVTGAEGMIVDNMLNGTVLQVQCGPIVEVCPAFQKTYIRLDPLSSPDVIIVGSSGAARVYFFTGSFHGNTQNTNTFAAYKAGVVTTNTDGTQDVYFNTVRWKADYKLANGFNLDNLQDSGAYDVLNPTNSGTPLAAGTWQIEHRTYSSSNLYAYQLARNLLSPGRQYFERRLLGGSGWTAWTDPTDLSPYAKIADVTPFVRLDAQTYSGAVQRQVRNNIGVRRWAGYIAAAASLTAAALNSVVELNSTFTLNVPPKASAIAWDQVEFLNIGTGTITLALPDAGTQFYSYVGATSTLVIGPGESAMIVWDGNTTWLGAYRAKPPERTVDKAGDTMNGVFRLLFANPALELQNNDGGAYNNTLWRLLQYGGDGRLYGQNTNTPGTNAYSWGPAGDLWTLQLGDLKTYADAKSPPLAQCVLFANSGTQLVLNPQYGSRVYLAGAYRKQVYTALSNSGMSANTVYHIYEAWNGSSLYLLSSVNGPSTSGVTGLPIYQSDETTLYVGTVVTNTNAQFQDTPEYRGVFSAWNRRRKNCSSSGPMSGTVGTSYAEPNTAGRAYFYADGSEAVDFGVVGTIAPTTFDNCFAYLGSSGGQAGPELKPTLGGSGAAGSISMRTSRFVSAGWQYMTVAARTGGSSATVNFQMEGCING